MPNKIEALPDGKIKAQLETGEIFEGDPLEVTTKLAEAQVNTKRWGQGFKQELETIKATPPPPPPTVDPNLKETSKWVWDTLAVGIGPEVTGEQLKNKLIADAEALKQLNMDRMLLNFKSRCRDFPDTDEASEKAVERAQQDFGIADMDEFAKVNPDVAAKCMEAAHRACVADGVYQPLSLDEQKYAEGDKAAIAQQRGQAPPPMIRSGAPDNNRGFDPWSKDVKLEDLRAMAIRQQLEGRG